MKKLLSVLAIAAVFAACKSNAKTDTDTSAIMTSPDTATLNNSAFTDKAEEIQLSGLSDTIIANDGNAYVKVKPQEAEPAPVVREKTTVRKATRIRKASSAGSGTATSKSESSTVSTSTPAGTGTETETTTTTTTKKKGWSKAAKGAIIGAGTGAAAGAIISKKKVKGAIIGGVVGGAGGYIIGRSKDKRWQVSAGYNN